MKYPEQLAIRVPAGTKARLRAQSKPGETLVSVLLRALTSLETGPERSADTEPRPDLAQRLASIEQRLGDIEQKPSLSPSPAPRPEQLIGQSEPPASRRSSSNRSQYPEEVRQLAVRMKDEGHRNAEIIAAIFQQVGRAPDLKNINKLLRDWANSSTQIAAD